MRLIFYRSLNFESSKKPCSRTGSAGLLLCTIQCSCCAFNTVILPGWPLSVCLDFLLPPENLPVSKIFWKFSEKRAEAGVSGVILAEREKSTRHPHGKGVRRWKLSLATMANSTDSMRSAKRYCEMRPGTITEIRNACLTVKSHSALFRWKNWESSRV